MCACVGCLYVSSIIEHLPHGCVCVCGGGQCVCACVACVSDEVCVCVCVCVVCSHVGCVGVRARDVRRRGIFGRVCTCVCVCVCVCVSSVIEYLPFEAQCSECQKLSTYRELHRSAEDSRTKSLRLRGRSRAAATSKRTLPFQLLNNQRHFRYLARQKISG